MKNIVILVLLIAVFGLSYKTFIADNQKQGLTVDDNGVNLNTKDLKIKLDNEGLTWDSK
jgi:hypothetical protein